MTGNANATGSNQFNSKPKSTVDPQSEGQLSEEESQKSTRNHAKKHAKASSTAKATHLGVNRADVERGAFTEPPGHATARTRARVLPTPYRGRLGHL